MMPHFDWTISFGTILEAITIVGGAWIGMFRLYTLFDKRLSVFEAMLTHHADTLTRHAERMDRQDAVMTKLTDESSTRTDKLTGEITARMDKQGDVLTKLTGEIQRVVGRMETWTMNRPPS
jgi:hypothetical protein